MKKRRRKWRVMIDEPGIFLQNKTKVGLVSNRCNKNNLTRPNSRNGKLKGIREEGYVTDLVLIFEGNKNILPSCYFYDPDCLFIKNIIVDLS